MKIKERNRGLEKNRCLYKSDTGWNVWKYLRPSFMKENFLQNGTKNIGKIKYYLVNAVLKILSIAEYMSVQYILF